MKQLSERVEREFKKWLEEYEVPLGEEFQVKTLLQLQEEYDETEIGSHTTRTRESLLSMIKSIYGSLRLRKKEKTLYIDLRNQFENNKLIPINSTTRGIGKTTNLMELAKEKNLPVVVGNTSQLYLYKVKYPDVKVYATVDVCGRGIKEYLVEEMPLETLLLTIKEIGHKPSGGYLYTDLI